MMVMKLKISKKAVSPVIATVLLIALVVAAAAIVYFVVIPMLRGTPQLVSTSITFSDTDSDKYADQITIQMQNIGSAAATIDNVTVRKFTRDLSWNPVQTLPMTISIQSSSTLILNAKSVVDAVKYPDKVTIILYNKGEVVATFDASVDPEFSPITYLYKEDFNDISDGQSPPGWEYFLIATHGGGTHTISDWQVQNGELVYTQNDCNFIILKDYSWVDVNISFNLYATDNDIMGIIFRYSYDGSTQRYYLVVYSNDHTLTDSINGPHYTGATMNKGTLYLFYAEDGPDNSGKLTLITSTSWTRVDNQWYNYMVVTEGYTIKVYIDGELKLEATDDTLAQGTIGLLCGAMQNAKYDDILVWTGE